MGRDRTHGRSLGSDGHGHGAHIDATLAHMDVASAYMDAAFTQLVASSALRDAGLAHMDATLVHMATPCALRRTWRARHGVQTWRTWSLGAHESNLSAHGHALC